MTVISRVENLHWLPHPNIMEMVLSETLPAGPASSAYAFVFRGDDLLMADLNRGIDIPGGHIDDGEAPEAAMRREVLEETGATVRAARLFAYQHITLLGKKPDGYRYPFPTSYQLMYFSTDFTQGDFISDDDSRGAVMISPAQAGDVAWIQRNRAIYEHALALARSVA
jgi:8-oxo-dGTP pyrophosphatase MutT (NUDIX family)